MGYGRIYKDGRNVTTHRASWELANGTIPAGLWVLHRCDNPPCVNPAHLFLGTNRDNIADRHAKGRDASGDRNGARTHPETRARGDRSGLRLHPERAPHGERNGNARLTEDQVRHIRVLAATGVVSKSAIARAFAVTHVNVCSIVARETWKRVA